MNTIFLTAAFVALLLVAFAAGVWLTVTLRRKGIPTTFTTTSRTTITDAEAQAMAALDAPLAFRGVLPQTKGAEPKGSASTATAKIKKDYSALKSEIHNDPAKLDYAKKGSDYEAIADLLNKRPLIPNPTPQGTVPRRLKLTAIVKKLTLPEAWELYKVGKLVEHIEQNLEPGDRAKLIDLVNICDPFLSDATEAKLDTLLNETAPDEDWPATVPGDSRATEIGWPTVTPADVQQVLG
ncbi:MAG: hypothetical protein WC718_14850 [Phycisphaerales bacterium]